MSAAPGQPDKHPQVLGLLAAFIALRDTVRNLNDPRAAFRLATAVEGELRRMNEEWAIIRGETVVRIRDTDATSLSVLAKDINLSKAAVHKLIKRVPPPEEGTRP